MSFEATVYRVLIGGPSDALEERRVAAAVVDQWNHDNATERRIVLLPAMWEFDTWPEYGSHPQETINRQMVDDCDAMIAIFKSHVGTPTREHLSGTVEELERIHDSGKEVMVYLYDGMVPSEVADSDRYKVYAQFRKDLRQKGLHSGFKSDIELKDKMRSHVTKLVTSFASLNGSRSDAPSSASSSEYIKSSDLAGSTVPDDEDPTVGSGTDHWWMILASEDHPSAETVERARQALSQQNEEKGDRERVEDEALFQYLLVTKGDTSALEKLEEMAQEQETYSESQCAIHIDLCHAYAHVGGYQLAYEAAMAALGYATTEAEHADATIAVAQTAYAKNNRLSAFRMLSEEAKQSRDRKVKHGLYVSLADLYDDAGMDLLQTLSLELATAYMPEDYSTRFQAARAYDAIEIPYMTLRHYERLIRSHPTEEIAINNLGVSLYRLNTKGLAIEHYERSAKLGSALAQANIAHLYINQGFFSDAERAIKQARELGAEPRISSAESNLASERTREADRREELRRQSASLSAMLLDAAQGALCAESVDFSGLWRGNDGVLVEVATSAGSVVATWTKSKSVYELRGGVAGRTILIDGISWSSDLAYPSRGVMAEKSLGVFDIDSGELRVLINKGDPPEYWILRREVLESSAATA